jgi:Protein of unknown function (DUF2380)
MAANASPRKIDRSTRRRLCVGAAAMLLSPSRGVAAQTRRVLVLDFELIDDQQDTVPFPEKAARLAMISTRLRESLAREKLYDVIDNAAHAQAIAELTSRYDVLGCNGCELPLARAAGAQRVLVGWVQKVSNLILNINIEVRDVESGAPVLNKSVDLRGNNDESWRRGIDFLVRDMVAKGQQHR